MHHWRWMEIAMGLALVSCTVPAPAPEESPALADPPPEIGRFDFEDIELRGCGMSLWAEGSDPRADGIYLFNALSGEGAPNAPPATMRMKINGEILAFERTEGSGAEFYGQYEFQSFVSADGDITVTVLAEMTSAPEPDSEVISVSGTITANRGSQEATVAVVGDAGC